MDVNRLKTLPIATPNGGSVPLSSLAAITVVPTPAQISRLEPRQREQVQKAVAMVGSVLIGKFISKELVLRAAQTVGVRLTAKQAAKYVPLAGQVVSAVVGYSAIRYLGEEHLKDCVRVALQVQLLLPAPGPQ